MEKLRIAVLTATVGVTAVALSSCSSGGSSGTSATSGGSTGRTYNIAIVADQSGSFATSYTPFRSGAVAAFDKINSASAGVKLKVSSYDSQSTAQGAVAAVRQALDNKPDAILLGVDQSVENGVANLLSSAKTTVLDSHPTTNLVGKDKFLPWAFSTGSISPQAPVYYLNFAKSLQPLSGKKVGCVGLDVAVVHTICDQELGLLAKEGAVKGPSYYNAVSGVTSFATQAAQVVSDNVDEMVVIDLDQDVTVVDQGLRAAGWKGALIAGEGSSDDALLQQLKDPLLYVARPYNLPQPGDVLSQAAKAAGVSASGSFFSNGWVAAYSVAAAAHACTTTCDSAGLAKTLETVTVNPPGNVAFAPVTYEKHFAVHAVQFFHWDDASSSVKPYSAPVPDADLTVLNGS